MGIVSLCMAANNSNRINQLQAQVNQNEQRRLAEGQPTNISVINSAPPGGVPAPTPNAPGSQMSVVVPEGANIGGILKVAYPDGVGSFDVQLPKEVTVGSTISVTIPDRSIEAINEVSKLRLEMETLRGESKELHQRLSSEQEASAALRAEMNELRSIVAALQAERSAQA